MNSINNIVSVIYLKDWIHEANPKSLHFTEYFLEFSIKFIKLDFIPPKTVPCLKWNNYITKLAPLFSKSSCTKRKTNISGNKTIFYSLWQRKKIFKNDNASLYELIFNGKRICGISWVTWFRNWDIMSSSWWQYKADLWFKNSF